MARRQQVNYSPDGGSLRPAANPLPFTPFVPRLRKPELLPVQELAGLSDALTEIGLQQLKKDHERARQAGLDEAAAAPLDLVQEIADAGKDLDGAEAKMKANQDAFAKARAEGKIHVSEDPWARVGFVEGAAHRVMQKYDQELQGRLSEVTATVDSQGNPVMGADPQAIIAQTWEKYQGTPLLRDFYGSRVAQTTKAEVDAKYTAQALRKQGEAQARATTEWVENTLADKFVQMSASGQEVTSEGLKTVGEFLTEARRKGLEDPRASVYRALDGASSRIDLNDDGSAGGSRAAAMLRQLLDAPVGNTTVGKDAVVGAKVRDLIAQYDRLHGEKAGDAARKNAAEKALALENGEREALRRIQQEQAAGNGDALGVTETYAQELLESNQFGDQTPFVVDTVRRLGLGQKAQASSVEAENLIADMAAGGDPQQLLNSARTLLRSGNMRTEDYGRLLKEQERQQAIAPLIEGDPQHQENMAELRRNAGLPGIPEDIGGDLRSDLNQQVDAFRQEEAAAADEALKLPPEQRDAFMRKWRQQNVPEFRARLRAASDQFRQERAKFQQEANDRLFHASSPEQVLHDHPEYFSAQEAAALRARAQVQADHERFLESDGYRDAEAFVLGTVTDQYKDIDPDNLRAIQESAKRELRETALARIGEALPQTDPSAQTALVRKVADEVAPQVLERVAQSNVVRFAKAAKPGAEGVPAARQLLDAGAKDLQRSDSIRDMDRAQQAAQLTSEANPNVPQTARDLQRAFLGGERRGTFGVLGRVDRNDLVDRAHWEVKQILDKPDLSDAAKAQATVDLLKVSGIPAEELLKGEVTVPASARWQGRIQQYKAQLEREGKAFARRTGQLVTGTVPGSDELISALDLAMDDVPKVNLKGATVPIYTTPIFRTMDDFEEWYRTRLPDLKTIAVKYGVPDGEPEFEKWVKHQKAAIRRLNQDAE